MITKSGITKSGIRYSTHNRILSVLVFEKIKTELTNFLKKISIFSMNRFDVKKHGRKLRKGRNLKLSKNWENFA